MFILFIYYIRLVQTPLKMPKRESTLKQNGNER